MKINSKYLVGISVLALAVVFVFSSTFLTSTQVNSANVYNAPKLGSTVWIQYRPSGTNQWETISNQHNLLLNGGRNITRDYLAGATAASGLVKNIALGNGTATQAATDLVLATEWGNECGLGRASGTINYDTANIQGNWSITKTFTNTCASAALVNTTALYNATLTAANSTFAETTFTSTTLQTNDQINITWFVWIS